MNMVKKIKENLLRTLGLISLLAFFACKEDNSIPRGLFKLVKSDSAKVYGVGCFAFSQEETPFRLQFIDERHVEVYPAMVKWDRDFSNERFLGLRGVFRIDEDKLVIKPVHHEYDSFVYDLTYQSQDSLVLNSEFGGLEYYKRDDPPMQKKYNSIWQIEIEASPNMTVSCSPYKLLLDSTGRLTFSCRDLKVNKSIPINDAKLIFKVISQIEKLEIPKKYEIESDDRSILFKTWVGSEILEIGGNSTDFSYELKRVLIVFDDFVYNYSNEKRLMVN
ncbi:MAG: hypothetical protein ACK514_01795 [Bacteroidota bacterium]|jgi:hypothetical protein|nr:hypothetical protein [Cytophagales bacterium]